MERILETLRIALQMKGEEIAGFFKCLRGLLSLPGEIASDLWELGLELWRSIPEIPSGIAALPRIPAFLWWWVIPGLVAWGAIISAIWICSKKIHRSLKILVGIGSFVGVLWVYWNVLAASMITWCYPRLNSPLAEAFLNTFMSFMVELVIALLAVLCLAMAGMFKEKEAED